MQHHAKATRLPATLGVALGLMVGLVACGGDSGADDVAGDGAVPMSTADESTTSTTATSTTEEPTTTVESTTTAPEPVELVPGVEVSEINDGFESPAAFPDTYRPDLHQQDLPPVAAGARMYWYRNVNDPSQLILTLDGLGESEGCIIATPQRLGATDVTYSFFSIPAESDACAAAGAPANTPGQSGVQRCGNVQSVISGLTELDIMTPQAFIVNLTNQPGEPFSWVGWYSRYRSNVRADDIPLVDPALLSC